MLKSDSSKFKDIEYTRDLVYYGRKTLVNKKSKEKIKTYSGLTVVVLVDGDKRHIGVSKVNPRKNKDGKKDSFNRYRGREVALGRALRSAAVARGLTQARTYVKPENRISTAKSLTLAIKPNITSAEAKTLAKELGELFEIDFPEFLLGLEQPKKVENAKRA